MNSLKALKEQVENVKVLFVDDEENIRNSMEIFLKKFFDNVIVGVDGEDGLDKFMKNQDIQVVITDILMPKMNGYDMVKKITELRADIFVIFITASKRDIEMNKQAKDIYLKKPLSFEDIKEVITLIGKTL